MLHFKDYACKKTFDAERVAFLKSPVLVCHKSEIPHVGSYLNITVFGESFLIVHSRSGIKAFQNLCPHRGAELCPRSRGRTKVFVCPYHSLHFDLSGECLSRREEKYNLYETPVRIQNNWVYLCLSQEAVNVNITPDVFDSLSAMQISTDYQADLDRDHHSVHVNLNWKHLIENTIEPLHVASVHPGLRQLLTVNSLQWKICQKYASMKIRLQKPKNRISLEFSYFTLVQALFGEPTWRYLYVFPNLHLSFFPEQMHLLLVMPQSESVSIVRSVYFVCPTASRLTRYARRINRRMSRQIWSEDLITLNKVLRGSLFFSGDKKPNYLVGSDDILVYFHKTLHEVVTTGSK